MSRVSLRVEPLGKRSFFGKTYEPQAKYALVHPQGLKLKLLQDPNYIQALRRSGFFDLPREAVSVGEAYQLHKMPADPHGEITSRQAVDALGKSLVAATTANEAPLHFNQLTYNEGIVDPLRSRELLSGLPWEGNGHYYSLVYSEATGIGFQAVRITRLQHKPDLSVVVSGKPLVWDGNKTTLEQYLPTCISDIRHVFVSPNIGGIPIISRKIGQMIRARVFDEIGDLSNRQGKFSISFQEIQASLKRLNSPALSKDEIKNQFAYYFGESLTATKETLEFPLIFNPYRHTFWAGLWNGDLLAGFISNQEKEDLEAIKLGLTIPELQNLMLNHGARWALAFGAGADNRLFHYSAESNSIKRNIDADAQNRDRTPSGMLAVISQPRR
ncbi:MAG: hypothetical protein JW873_00075 [Candidatus Saganbacteria bacterium]|nr:hypothetical protein [Candidatus Saganbacteria bacterium]